MPADVAGLGEGDVITRWDRGPVTTPFDLLELEMVEAPRGPVTLTVVREGKARSIKLPIGEWRLTARPVLPPELDTIDVQARQALTASRFAEATGGFERLAKALTDAGRPRDAGVEDPREAAHRRRPGDAVGLRDGPGPRAWR